MVRFSLIVFLVALFAAGCGNNDNQQQKQQPGKTTPTSQTQPSPTQPSPTGGASKWNASELQSQSQYCSQNGDTTYYEASNWLTFCTCFYTEAAKQWTYQEFFADFDGNYTTLYNAGKVNACLQQAGMTAYLR